MSNKQLACIKRDLKQVVELRVEHASSTDFCGTSMVGHASSAKIFRYRKELGQKNNLNYVRTNQDEKCIQKECWRTNCRPYNFFRYHQVSVGMKVKHHNHFSQLKLELESRAKYFTERAKKKLVYQKQIAQTKQIWHFEMIFF